jgi:enamine deaminase RidA (YjgF/YER057c/UK114 family)
MNRRAIEPEGWAPPKGYANGVLVEGGRTLYVAGQIGWDAEQRLVSPDFVPQFRQALENVVAVVRAAGGAPEHLVRTTIYVTDKQAYLGDLKGVGAAWRETIGRHFPAMTLVEVADLLEPGALVEIECTAVLPDA